MSGVRVRCALLAVSLAAVAAGISLVACGRRAPAVAGVPDVVDFNFDVRPILSDRCFACHGPDERARKAGLRLDRQQDALAKLPSGHRAIVPGSAWRSTLVARVTSDDPAFRMPAPESRLALDAREKEILVRWIEQGAPWKPHWSFVPPHKAALPPVRRRDWCRGEVDRFVLAAMEGKGLGPSPEASRETLVRRLSLDLTGLPPTLEEVDAFLADRSSDAYERLVDRLLASPAYGERMAADWLDIARYADSFGYQDDGMRAMWPWRDWVIAAFNRNLRYDQFLTWQLAGDLLPGATQEQVLATGFNRNHMQTQEGGVVPEEYRTEYVADRVTTLGRAFLGLSIECARCHDHKYDPLKQAEYYSLFAFFNNVNETGQIPYSGMPSPTLIVTDAAADARLTAVRGRIESLETQLRPEAPAFDAGLRAWLARAPKEALYARAAVAPGLIVHLTLDAAQPGIELTKGDPKAGVKPKPKRVLRFANAADPRSPATLGGDEERVPVTVEGKIGRAQRLVGDSHIGLGDKVAFFERNQPFSLGLWFRIEKAGAAGPLVTRSGGLFNGNRGYEILLRPDGTFSAGLHHVFPDNSLEVETVRPVAPGAWHHVALSYDGSSRASGLVLSLDGRLAQTRVRVDNLRRSILHDQKGKNWGDSPGLRLGRRQDETLQDVSVDELRVYDRQLTALELAALGEGPDTLAHVLSLPETSRTAAQRAALREHYLLRVAPGTARALKALEAARGEENALLTSLDEVMVLRELPEPRPTFILARGRYDAPSDRVEPATPQVLGEFPARLPRNRLGLARWLCDPRHPLTARVIVNRSWAMVFGRGIVATPADFGSQGRLPTHPELLDWLAVTFVESGWDVKALIKRLVSSATYRQSSAADAARLEADPANEWLSRGPSYRLAAEQVRDEALAASGLLAGRLGGPSVYPYQPPGLWEELATRNATSYQQGHGDELYRRSLYTVWKRSTPPPSAVSFDAADRLFCTVTRQRTSTPLQALVLLNDPQYLEAARLLGERMLREGGADDASRVAYGFRLLTSRRPDGEELKLLRALLDGQRRRFAGREQAARQLLSVGERKADRSLPAVDAASYAVVASTLLSFDEVVFKR